MDYFAAINRIAGQGVTPENNAVVLLWQVLDREKVDESVRDEYFHILGITEPPDDNVLSQPL
ncbi:MAG: hypothetical protein IH991_13075 [Planctomycetes bacterium]|nr:hypothetical protein [Planctomycetota bacterium]